MMINNSINILLVEDNPADVDLTREAFEEAKLRNTLYVCTDGIEALDFLYRRDGYSNVPRPDIILLDLNMPRMSGQEVLIEISKDQNLRAIPLVVLTTSDDEKDIANSYANNANCYITKPVDFTQFFDVVKSIESFWLTVVKLPATNTIN